MKRSTFFPGYRLMSLFKRTTERFFEKFYVFVLCCLSDNDNLDIQRSKDSLNHYARNLIAGFVFANFDFLGEGENRKSDWDFACKFFEEHFNFEKLYVRHIIYNAYCFFLMKNARHPRAAGGSYDTSFASMLIVLVGKKDAPKYVQKAISEGYPGWMHWWIMKVCRRKMANFLPRDLYTRREGVPIKEL